MSEVVEAGDCVMLICGDAERVLADMCAPDGTAIEPAHCLVTDPPYRLTAGGAFTGEMKGKFSKEIYANDGALVDCDIDWKDWLAPAYGALRADADAYVMANDKNMREAQVEAEAAGFRLHNVLVWQKDTITPNRWYMKNLEFVLYLFKGRARTINDPSSPQLVRCPTPRNARHQTQKPVGLMELFIRNSTEKGDLVLDPFMGSGATGVAALRAGRRFIGIEKNREHFERARQWIMAEAFENVDRIARLV